MPIDESYYTKYPRQVEQGKRGFPGVGSSGFGGIWGTISGTLSNQTDLQSALNLKAPVANPTFTGSVALSGTGDQWVTLASSDYNKAGIKFRRGTDVDAYPDFHLYTSGGQLKLDSITSGVEGNVITINAASNGGDVTVDADLKATGDIIAYSS